jgi:hypothetical protein
MGGASDVLIDVPTKRSVLRYFCFSNISVVIIEFSASWFLELVTLNFVIYVFTP